MEEVTAFIVDAKQGDQATRDQKTLMIFREAF